MSDFTITRLEPGDEGAIEAIAALLQANFTQAWQERDEAIAEVGESFAAERYSLAARDSNGEAIGWIGGVAGYSGNAVELHPLVVRADWQGKGVGRALVEALEAAARSAGVTTIYLGTDDEDNRTTLAGADLYPDVLARAREIQNPGRHPYEFYQRCGYVIVGVIPDANGPGKPDIFMAKRL